MVGYSMILKEKRDQVIAIARKSKEIGLVPLTFGNFSLRDKKTGYICITPSGMDYDELCSEDIVIVDIDGRIIEGQRKPSVETPMHCKVYNRRNDVYGLCHTHSPYATAWACCNIDFPILVEELAALVGEKLPKAAYRQTGTAELAEVVVAALQDKAAVLMSNHGFLAVGRDLNEAFTNAIVVEEGAKIAYYTRSIGEAKLIPKTVCRKVRNWVKENYGQ
jgi:L-ribulose-5-phosphate 4-epimerase